MRCGTRQTRSESLEDDGAPHAETLQPNGTLCGSLMISELDTSLRHLEGLEAKISNSRIREN